MSIRRVRVSTDVEDELLAAMVLDDTFLRLIRSAYDPGYFGGYGSIISRWAVEYYDEYNVAPKSTIESIYNAQKELLSTGLQETIAHYLARLSAEYTHRTFNIPYLVKQALAHFKKRAYERLFARGCELMAAGRVQDAIALQKSFTDTVREKLSPWVSIQARDVLYNHLVDIEAGAYDVFTFRGALGRMLGSFERGWLVSFLGPMKRGKSYWLQEVVFCAAVAKRNVAYINLEMLDHGVKNRMYSRLVGYGPKTPDTVYLPIFDCRHNQRGTCPVKNKRINDIALYTNRVDTDYPLWDAPGVGDYRVCTVCRGDKELRRYYTPDVWRTHHKPKGAFDFQYLLKHCERFSRQYGMRMYHATYPAYSVTLDDIASDLDDLSQAHNVRPDVVVVDYADIIASSHKLDERAHLNSIWKGLKSLAQRMDVLCVTASQTNRQAIEKNAVSQKDIAEDIRKLAHVDVMIALNQTEGDKRRMMTRLACIAHRHQTQTIRQVAVLHQLDLGLPYLDSEIWDD